MSGIPQATTDTRRASRRDEHAGATRAALAGAAEALFARRGFQATTIDAIAARARVTKGAFYHHFTDKRAAFESVLEGLLRSVTTQVKERALAEPDKWRRLEVGIDAYLLACRDPVYRKIVVLEGASVLGEERFREIDEQYPVNLLIANVRALSKSGRLKCPDPDLLAWMLSAMITEASRQMHGKKNIQRVQRRAFEILGTVLKAFSTSASP
jgi:AcrR family transcriptional regulator